MTQSELLGQIAKDVTNIRNDVSGIRKEITENRIEVAKLQVEVYHIKKKTSSKINTAMVWKLLCLLFAAALTVFGVKTF